jgi:hypothetical protein
VLLLATPRLRSICNPSSSGIYTRDVK